MSQRASYVSPSFDSFLRLVGHSASGRTLHLIDGGGGDTRFDEFRAAFKRYSTDGSMRLDQWEVRQVFQDVGVEPTEEELRAIAHAIAQSKDGNGITYEEFIAILMKYSFLSGGVSDDAGIVEAFVALGGSSDKSGCVDADKIKGVIETFGLTINIHELLELLDSDHSGQIEFEEFKCLFEEDEEMVNTSRSMRHWP